MKRYYKDRLDQLTGELLPSEAQTNIGAWICENTKIKGKPFSFKDHEYQKFVCEQEAAVINLKKPSQYGLTELALRRALGFLQINQGTTAMYCFPTSSFALSVSKGRMSSLLRSGITSGEKLTVSGTDSAGIKELKNGSMIYFIGATTDRQVISVPADLICQDELDFFADPNVPSKLNSRLTHSKFKWKLSLSTPTLPNMGISSAYDASRQYVELQQCDKCNHHFQTDYYKHIKLPGFKGDIREFNYANRKILDRVSVDDAYVFCPKCGRPVDTSAEYRQWVCVNPETKYPAVGIHITPFAGPNIISPSGLISVACEYKLVSDFVNFGLGENYEDASTGLLRDEVENCFKGTQDFSVPFAVMGLDLGGLSACTIGVPGVDGGIVVVHTEMIPLKNLNKRVAELYREYNVIQLVSDAYPYTDSVLKMQLELFEVHAAVFTQGMQLYKEVTKADDGEAALSGMQVVNISRERALDYTAAAVRDGDIIFVNCEEQKETICDHLTDLKRGKVYDSNGDMIYKWKKSSTGEDHYFFSLLYLNISALMCGFGERFGTNVGQFPLVSSFRDPRLDED